MTFRFWLVTVCLLVGSALVGALRAGEADWFAQSGYTIMEAVGNLELGYILVGQNEAGKFEFLSRGEWYRDRFRVEGIGEEQVRVLAKDKTISAVPILHRNIPSDIFLVAMSMLSQRSVIVVAQPDSLKPFTPELLSDANALAKYCKEEGLDYRMYDDCLIVRKGTFPVGLKPYTSTEPQLACNMQVLRGGLGDVARALAEASGKVVAPNGAYAGQLSVKSYGLSPQALSYYLQNVVDVGLKIEEPKPTPSPSPSAVAGSPKGSAIKERFKSLIRSGQFLAAARFSQNVIKKYPGKATGYNLYGLALWKLGHKQTAIKAWEKALKMEPSNAYAQQVLRKVRSQQQLVKGKDQKNQPSAGL